MPLHSLVAVVGRWIGLAVMVSILAALLIGYASSLRHSRHGGGDPAFEALVKAKRDELRAARQEHRRQRP